MKLLTVASFIFYHVGYAPGPKKLPKNVLFPIIDRKIFREYEKCKIENTEVTEWKICKIIFWKDCMRLSKPSCIYFLQKSA